jgi:pyruvate, orthophosphate dikinase
LAALTDNARFAYDAYRRLVEGFGKVVLEIPDTSFEHALHSMKEELGVSLDTDLTTDDLKKLTAQFKAIVQEAQGLRVPAGPHRAAPPGD